MSAHPTRLIAIPFIMIVVTTSCAPVLTFRMPGMAAQIIPPSIAASSTAGTSSGPGRKSRLSSATVAVIIATRY